MESWGSEFFDDGAYGAEYAPSLFPETEMLIPITLLDKIVDKGYIAEIMVRDNAALQGLTSSMSINGQIEAGTLTYDNKTIRLKNGNHRYLAAKALGWKVLRLRLRRVNHIATAGLPLEQVLPDLMLDLFSANKRQS